MTTELDRLLEVHDLVKTGNGYTWQKLVQEEKSLKSQIESKLAQADKIQTRKNKWVEQTVDEVLENEELKQELSQLRPIVQKIQNQIQNLKEHHKTGYSSNPDCYEWGVTLLESILDSKSESKDGN